jgi:peptide/nickel transport system permease protein
MSRYVIRRLLQMIPLLIFISILSYSISVIAPGDPVQMFLPPEKKSISPEAMAALRHKYGLDQPIYLRYFSWVKNTLQGNWGYSYRSHDLVTKEVLSRLPNTIILGVSSLIFTLLISIPMGVLSAIKRYSVIDYSVTIGAFLGLSLPTFWFALILIEFFANRLGWLPSMGMQSLGGQMTSTEKFFDVAKHLVLPVLTLSITNLAYWSRYQRATLLENLNQDFVRTARAKGLKHSTVIWRHAFRNALIPMVTLLGMSLPDIVGGAVITETIFGWPGMGRLGIDSISSRDYPVVMAVTMILALMVVVGNLLADISYAFVDPRIRFD